MLRRSAFVLIATLGGCRPDHTATPPTPTPPSTTPSPTTDAATPAKHGVHGMVLFGRDTLYASHLPMYQAPHDVQTVLRIVPEDPEILASWRRDLAAQPLVTFVPEPFDLARLRDGGAIDLVGDIYVGHFERDGTVWSESVPVRAEVVFYRPIPVDPPVSRDAIAFGDGNQTYLVPIIGPRPGVDRIVAVDGPAPAEAQTVVFDDASLAQHGWTKQRVVYEEHADLQ